MVFLKAILFCVSAFGSSNIQYVYGTEDLLGYNVEESSSSKKMVEEYINEEYGKLRKEFQLTKFNWKDKNALKNRKNEISNNISLISTQNIFAFFTKGEEVSAILSLEKLYSIYTVLPINTYDLLFDNKPKNISKGLYELSCAKNINDLIKWLCVCNKDVSYLIQMPFIMGRLFDDILQVEIFEFKKKLWMELIDEMWSYFLFKDINNDPFDIFKVARYENCTQQKMDIVIFKMTELCIKVFNCMNNYIDEDSDSDENSDEDSDSNSTEGNDSCILDEEGRKNFKKAIADSYIFQKTKGLLNENTVNIIIH